MNKVELLKEKLLVINEKLEMERNFQSQTIFNTDEMEQSINRELHLLTQKKSVLNSLQSEIESQLNND